MSEELFDVVFFGILQTGKDKDIVLQNMAKMFKTDATKLAPYFAGGRKVIKGKVNADMAKKYQVALENVGLVIKLEACETQTEKNDPTPSSPAEPPQQTTPPQAQSNNTEIDTGDISIAPVGANVIENPVEVVAQKIDDISDISMAETGANVLENPVIVPAQKIDDISGITMSEVGANVLEHSEEVIPQKIDDISNITMAEAGENLLKEPKPEIKADIPDTSGLSLD